MDGYWSTFEAAIINSNTRIKPVKSRFRTPKKIYQRELCGVFIAKQDGVGLRGVLCVIQLLFIKTLTVIMG